MLALGVFNQQFSPRRAVVSSILKTGRRTREQEFELSVERAPRRPGRVSPFEVERSWRVSSRRFPIGLEENSPEERTLQIHTDNAVSRACRPPGASSIWASKARTQADSSAERIVLPRATHMTIRSAQPRRLIGSIADETSRGTAALVDLLLDSKP